MPKKIAVNITAAVSIGGKIIAPSSPEAKGLELDEPLAKNLLHRGRAVLATAIAAPADDEDEDQDKPLEDMTVDELKKLAKTYSIEGADGMKKADLIAAIEKAEDE